MTPFTTKRAKTPTVIQMEAVECGAAALGIILAYYGKYLPLEELREDCGVSRDGSLASNILKAGKKYGLISKGFKYELEDLKYISAPYIVFWNFNHFVVVEGFKKNCVYINDPGTGPRKVTWQEFDESYTGVVLTFSPSETFTKGGVKEGLLSALIPRLKGSEKSLLFLFLVGLLLLIPGIALPTFLQIFIDNILVKKLTSQVGAFVFAMVLAASVIAILNGLQGYYLNRLNGKLSVKLSSQFLWHILSLPVQFYTQRYGGEISYRLQANDNLIQTLTGRLAATAINVILVIVYGALMVVYDFYIALIAFAAAIVNLVMVTLINRSRTDSNIRLQQDYGKSIGYAIGTLQNIETIKSISGESDFFSRWAGYFARINNSTLEIGKKDVILNTIPPFTQVLTNALVLILGAQKVINGEMTLGMLVALQTLMNTFLFPIIQFVFLAQSLQNVRAELHRLDDVLLNPVDPLLNSFLSDVPNPNEPLKLKGFLELKNITFGYNPLGKPILENFNLKLTPGKSIALVGPSGCGKSTVAKLVTGLFQPWQGEIFFDGKQVNQLSRPLFVRSVASVDQEIFFFGGTIKDNLTLWDSTIPEEDITKAAQDATIHSDIITRDKGYDALMKEGGHSFSGGQKQCLEIARSLVRNPSLLVLDEATSALDSETEAEILQKIRQRGCSTLVIAHRLSTIRDCDEIILLDHGKILQQGSHDQLKNEPGLYRDMIQLEGLE